MVSRQQAVLSFVKFNKFFKQLAYDVSISGHVKLTPYFDELLNFEQWSNDVIEYISPVILIQSLSRRHPYLVHQ